MRPVNALDISFRQIQMFLATAELGSQIKAAQFLYVTQPVLSKNLAAFERELGLMLFVHKHNKLALTPAGRTLRDELRGISNSIEKAIVKAHEAQMALAEPLVLGLPVLTDEQRVIMPMLEHYLSVNKDFQYRLEYGDFHELPGMLETGEIDLFFTGQFDIHKVESMGFAQYPIAETQPAVFVRNTSPLAGRQAICAQDLQALNAVVLSPALLPSYLEFFSALLARFGSSPNIGYYTKSMQSLGANIRSEEDFFFADSACKPIEGLTMIPFEGIRHALLMVWQPKATERVLDFVRSVTTWAESTKPFITAPL